MLYVYKARAHMSQKDHKQREWFKVAILEIETSGFFAKVIICAQN